MGHERQFFFLEFWRLTYFLFFYLPHQRDEPADSAQPWPVGWGSLTIPAKKKKKNSKANVTITQTRHTHKKTTITTTGSLERHSLR